VRTFRKYFLFSKLLGLTHLYPGTAEIFTRLFPATLCIRPIHSPLNDIGLWTVRCDVEFCEITGKVPGSRQKILTAGFYYFLCHSIEQCSATGVPPQGFRCARIFIRNCVFARYSRKKDNILSFVIHTHCFIIDSFIQHVLCFVFICLHSYRARIFMCLLAPWLYGPLRTLASLMTDAHSSLF
jgi:hypothetical protein